MANSNSGVITLSNGEEYANNDYVWIKVEPIIWIRHPKDNYFINEKKFAAGIRFCNERGGYDGNFNKTELKWYLDNYLAKDLVNPIVYNYLNNYKKKETINNFIYKDKDGNTVKHIKIKVKTKKEI